MNPCPSGRAPCEIAVRIDTAQKRGSVQNVQAFEKGHEKARAMQDAQGAGPKRAARRRVVFLKLGRGGTVRPPGGIRPDITEGCMRGRSC